MAPTNTPIRPLRSLSGTGISLVGDDIDTDRIVPGRFLKCITFAGIERNVFADDRMAWWDRGLRHPFDDPARTMASILVVNRNFGCGSSREHAPRALRQWGIAGIIGESFGDIFAANSAALGMPCVRVTREVVAFLQSSIEASTGHSIRIDLDGKTGTSGDTVFPIDLPEGVRSQFLAGTWDALSVLLAAGDEIERIAWRLPYLCADGGILED